MILGTTNGNKKAIGSSVMTEDGLKKAVALWVMTETGLQIDRFSTLTVGEVNSLAGNGTLSSVDGTGDQASFNNPYGIALYRGFAYISDTGSHLIRRMNLTTSEVVTFAGSGADDDVDDIGTLAAFSSPRNIVIQAGVAYISDSGNHKIRKIDIETAEVTTFCGSGILGDRVGSSEISEFKAPRGLALYYGNLYVCDSDNNKIKRISLLSGESFEFAGDATGVAGITDGVGSVAKFDHPQGLAMSEGYLFVCDHENNLLRSVNIEDAEVETIVGSGASGSVDGTGGGAEVGGLSEITVFNSRGYEDRVAYITDVDHHQIREVNLLTNRVTTFAGNGVAGDVDGVGTSSSFSGPIGIASDRNYAYICDSGTNKVKRMVTADITTGTLDVKVVGVSIYREADTYSNGDTFYIEVEFDNSINLDRTGFYPYDLVLYVRTSAGQLLPVSSYGGSGNVLRFFYELTGEEELFTSITVGDHIVLLGSELWAVSHNSGAYANTYIDASTVTTTFDVNYVGELSTEVTTFAGSGSSGNADGIGALAEFGFPYDIDKYSGFAYICDSGNQKIRKLNLSTAEVTTFAGSGSSGNADGIGALAEFSTPHGIAIASGFAYVCDSFTNTIRKIDLSTSEVTTLAGSGSSGDDDGIGVLAKFRSPIGIAIDSGFAYVCDVNNDLIRRVNLSTAEVTTFAGFKGSSGDDDGVGLSAKFDGMRGISIDSGVAYIGDSGNHKIRKIDLSTAEVTTLAGGERAGDDDGTGASAGFKTPHGLVIDSGAAYVCDASNYKIRKITLG